MSIKIHRWQIFYNSSFSLFGDVFMCVCGLCPCAHRGASVCTHVSVTVVSTHISFSRDTS